MRSHTPAATPHSPLTPLLRPPISRWNRYRVPGSGNWKLARGIVFMVVNVWKSMKFVGAGGRRPPDPMPQTLYTVAGGAVAPPDPPTQTLKISWQSVQPVICYGGYRHTHTHTHTHRQRFLKLLVLTRAYPLGLVRFVLNWCGEVVSVIRNNI